MRGIGFPVMTAYKVLFVLLTGAGNAVDLRSVFRTDKGRASGAVCDSAGRMEPFGHEVDVHTGKSRENGDICAGLCASWADRGMDPWEKENSRPENFPLDFIYGFTGADIAGVIF